ncbi:gluconate 2-dehydrogenase subunit 3 family protein [Novosphingobium sp. PASSN1]|uniref:gluconate 2-dehydrogenase subunit 3 family protein n=1 Tax=Novosphingobium sp. PASSN1 TaxID=2015561 RepID=UPI000BC37FE6|nr:gluconate 2-dehydrogenase subunit 3 family protein [Novosphingobium sp. PASSN1]OYU35414.1 MAG: twin-arginine translocation pathway signal protein [Novosphingobium sp. PASSN1]
MTGWNRRSFLGAASLVALLSAAPGGAEVLHGLDPAEAPSPHQRTLMRTAAEHVIPTTETPGAGALGVDDFVFVALAQGLEGTRLPPAADATFTPFLRSDGSLDHIAWLEARLGPKWLTLPPASRHAQLAALDAAAFSNDPAAAPWRKLKGLILTGYYTSETGGSRELKYELVPGRFDPKVPVTPETRAYSSDWTAVDFG